MAVPSMSKKAGNPETTLSPPILALALLRELSDAAVRSRGGLIDVCGALHLESFMRTLVVELVKESVELRLLLKEVRTGRPRSFHL